MTISAPVIEANKKDVVALNWVSCICYWIWSKKNNVQALINSGSKINAMTLRYASKLGLKVRSTNGGAQKFDKSTFKMFEIVLASFQVEDKLKKTRFFQETFLLANLNIKVVLEILFLTLSNANI